MQPAEHPERRGLARPVGPEQPEQFASMHFKADMIDRGEMTELLDQVAHLHDDLAPVRLRGVGERHCPVMPLARVPPQEHHEPVLEPRRRRNRVS